MLLAQFDAPTLTLRNIFALTVPEIVLLAVACVIFLGGTVWSNRHLWAAVSLAGLGAAFALFWTRVPPTNIVATVSPLLPDAFADVVRFMAFGGGALLLLLFWNDVDDARAADFHACALLLIAGVSLVGAANDLITLFLALELISIPTYVMLYLPRTGAAPQESAVKYFLLSIFSSGLLLFGFSYMYGAEGVTNLTAFFVEQSKRGDSVSGLLMVAVVMIVAGLGFRITAVPFHFYAPDVFQGAPTSVAAMLAFVPKVAGFTALVRVLGLLMNGSGIGLAAESQVALLFWLLAAITMTAGNILALLQDDLKRLLAYSSVAHGGYMLIGLAAAPHLRGGPRGLLGVDGVFFYLVAYGAMTIGAFAVLHYLRTSDREPQTVDDLAGLGRSQPVIALAFAVFLFSLIGLPLTAGFSGKFLLFFSALEAETRLTESKGLFIGLTIIGAINAAIGAYYYLRIAAVMFLRDGIRPPRGEFRLPAILAITICLILTVGMGVYPTPVVQAIRNAVATSVLIPAPEKAAAMR